MSILYSAIPFFVILGLLVFVHEFGHYWAAKRAGMKVHAFAIGMGPALWTIKRSSRLPGGEEYVTTYSICAIPIGGYVKIAGMDPNEDPNEPGGFNDRPWGWRFVTLIGGCTMNFVTAALLFCIVGTFIGFPGDQINRINEVIQDMPAGKAGILPGDRIIGIEGQKTTDAQVIREKIESEPGRPIRIVVQRGAKTMAVKLTPALDKSDGTAKGRIGIVFETLKQRVNPVTALVMGVQRTGEMTYMMIHGLVLMVMGKVEGTIGGPVMIFRTTGEAAQRGVSDLIGLAAMLSINLGIINLLPIPALDGGRILFLLIEALRGGRRVDPMKEAYVHYVGFVLLLLLMVFITFHDILDVYHTRGG